MGTTQVRHPGRSLDAEIPATSPFAHIAAPSEEGDDAVPPAPAGELEPVSGHDADSADEPAPPEPEETVPSS